MNLTLEQKSDIENAIKNKEVPKYLYKYRFWHCGGHKGPKQNCKLCERNRLILTKQAIWFASPSSFNDPFDCKIPYRYDLLNEQTIRKRMKELNKNVSDDEISNILTYNPIFSKDPEKRKAAYRNQSKIISNNYGIFSLAGNYKNILLWSHYADSHRGYCIELDAHLLIKELYSLLYPPNNVAIDVYQVTYQEEMPIIIPTDNKEEDLQNYIQILTVKSNVWEYENEWRFIYEKNTNLSRYIPKQVIKRIIIGCEMPDDDKKNIIRVVTEQLPNTQIWEAQKDQERFRLEFKQIQTA